MTRSCVRRPAWLRGVETPSWAASLCQVRSISCRHRVIDELLDEWFPHLAAIALEGARGVGKTATAMQRSQTLISLGLPASGR